MEEPVKERGRDAVEEAVAAAVDLLAFDDADPGEEPKQGIIYRCQDAGAAEQLARSELLPCIVTSLDAVERYSAGTTAWASICLACLLTNRSGCSEAIIGKAVSVFLLASDLVQLNGPTPWTATVLSHLCHALTALLCQFPAGFVLPAGVFEALLHLVQAEDCQTLLPALQTLTVCVENALAAPPPPCSGWAEAYARAVCTAARLSRSLREPATLAHAVFVTSALCSWSSALAAAGLPSILADDSVFVSGAPAAGEALKAWVAAKASAVVVRHYASDAMLRNLAARACLLAGAEVPFDPAGGHPPFVSRRFRYFYRSPLADSGWRRSPAEAPPPTQTGLSVEPSVDCGEPTPRAAHVGEGSTGSPSPLASGRCDGGNGAPPPTKSGLSVEPSRASSVDCSEPTPLAAHRIEGTSSPSPLAFRRCDGENKAPLPIKRSPSPGLSVELTVGCSPGEPTPRAALMVEGTTGSPSPLAFGRCDGENGAPLPIKNGPPPGLSVELSVGCSLGEPTPRADGSRLARGVSDAASPLAFGRCDGFSPSFRCSESDAGAPCSPTWDRPSVSVPAEEDGSDDLCFDIESSADGGENGLADLHELLSIARRFVEDGTYDGSELQTLFDYEDVLLDGGLPEVRAESLLHEQKSRLSGLLRDWVCGDKSVEGDEEGVAVQSISLVASHCVSFTAALVAAVAGHPQDGQYLTEAALADMASFLGTHAFDLPSSIPSLAERVTRCESLRVSLLKPVFGIPKAVPHDRAAAWKLPFRRVASALATLDVADAFEAALTALRRDGPPPPSKPQSLRQLAPGSNPASGRQASSPTSRTLAATSPKKGGVIPPGLVLTMSAGGCPLLSWAARTSAGEDVSTPDVLGAVDTVLSAAVRNELDHSLYERRAPGNGRRVDLQEQGGPRPEKGAAWLLLVAAACGKVEEQSLELATAYPAICKVCDEGSGFGVRELCLADDGSYPLLWCVAGMGGGGGGGGGGGMPDGRLIASVGPAVEARSRVLAPVKQTLGDFTRSQPPAVTVFEKAPPDACDAYPSRGASPGASRPPPYDSHPPAHRKKQPPASPNACVPSPADKEKPAATRQSCPPQAANGPSPANASLARARAAHQQPPGRKQVCKEPRQTPVKDPRKPRASDGSEPAAQTLGAKKCGAAAPRGGEVPEVPNFYHRPCSTQSKRSSGPHTPIGMSDLHAMAARLSHHAPPMAASAGMPHEEVNTFCPSASPSFYPAPEPGLAAPCGSPGPPNQLAPLPTRATPAPNAVDGSSLFEPPPGNADPRHFSSASGARAGGPAAGASRVVEHAPQDLLASLNDRREANGIEERQASLNNRREANGVEERPTSLNNRREANGIEEREASLNNRREANGVEERMASMNSRKEANRVDGRKPVLAARMLTLNGGGAAPSWQPRGKAAQRAENPVLPLERAGGLDVGRGFRAVGTGGDASFLTEGSERRLAAGMAPQERRLLQKVIREETRRTIAREREISDSAAWADAQYTRSIAQLARRLRQDFAASRFVHSPAPSLNGGWCAPPWAQPRGSDSQLRLETSLPSPAPASDCSRCPAPVTPTNPPVAPHPLFLPLSHSYPHAASNHPAGGQLAHTHHPRAYPSLPPILNAPRTFKKSPGKLRANCKLVPVSAIARSLSASALLAESTQGQSFVNPYNPRGCTMPHDLCAPAVDAKIAMDQRRALHDAVLDDFINQETNKVYRR
ncbi:hypothetical protein DIPPA_35022 [Diplonema papillatum]|nr:hypothetical protein DIPPA_35022 [Diplonema papillatum]